MAARRMQLGVGVGLVLLLGVVLALVLLRDPAGGSPSASPPTQPVPTRPDMDQLRAEATAAAETLFKKIDEADASGNPAVLDGLYTEGAKNVEDGQKKAVADRAAQGLITVRQSRVTDVQVEELTPQLAKVRLTWEILRGEIREKDSGKVRYRGPKSATPVRLVLERIDNRWLVGRLTLEGED
jgi:hypothetical protein